MTTLEQMAETAGMFAAYGLVAILSVVAVFGIIGTFAKKKDDSTDSN